MISITYLAKIDLLSIATYLSAALSGAALVWGAWLIIRLRLWMKNL